MKTVLITGGAKRLGRALVEHYAQQGWKVIFTVRHSLSEGISLAKQFGDNVHCLHAEVSSQNNAVSIMQEVQQLTDKLNLLVCSASTFTKKSIQDTTEGHFIDLLGSNLLGPYFLIQQCIPLLTSANGCVVNIADAQANSGIPNFSAYVAAKAGLISITKSLAVELAPTIRVNAVLPGSLPWPETEAEYELAERAKMTGQIPMQRIGEWKDVVSAVDYMQNSPFITGACLPVDGGRTAVY